MTDEPRSGATWTVLGAGSILPRAGYGPAGYALRPAPGAGVTLFDCGPGTIRSLDARGIGLAEVERVVISHFHPDHTLDLFALFFARRNPHLRASLSDLELIGPTGLARLVEAGRGVWGRWVEDPRVMVRETGETGASGGVDLGAVGSGSARIRLSCRRTHHTREALAWRADLDSGSVTFSGDTDEHLDVAELARNTSLFTCECSFAEGRAVPGHLTPRGAGRLAAHAGCQRLLLTHFYPRLDPEEAALEAAREFDGEILVAKDGAVFDVTRP